jgi:hypothetical protein
MSTDAIHLDEQTMACVMQLAEENNMSGEEVISQAIYRCAATPTDQHTANESIIGLFSEVPQLIDEIVEEVYRDRETMPFRLEPK